MFLGLLMTKFYKVSARLSFSSKYCSAVAEKAMKPLMYHETMSIFLGSKNFLDLAYFWVVQKYAVSDPPSHTNRGPPGSTVSSEPRLITL